MTLSERTWKPRISRLSICTTLLALFAGSTAMLAPAPAEAASLTPTRPALLRQVSQARSHGFTYASNSSDVSRLLRAGELVALPGNRDYIVKHTVRLPYARPEVKLFVERLSSQYRAACGEKLVVTSLIRPTDQQPPNSSPLSVHPTGMALDLRVSSDRRCRVWLESALVGLEASGTLEAARERRPPHYHVVVFPNQYARYVEAKTGRAPVASGPRLATYRVRRGDSLWTIARSHRTTVRDIQRANGLRGTAIRPSQVLKVPVSAR
jgi:LysM repeat protein